MIFDQCLIFVTFCGLLGIFLRRNLLNIVISLLQIVIGINALLSRTISLEKENSFSLYLLIFLIFALIMFFHAIAVLMIKRRSTVRVNELTELRG